MRVILRLLPIIALIALEAGVLCGRLPLPVIPAASAAPTASPSAASEARTISPVVAPSPSPSRESSRGRQADFRRLLSEVERLRGLRFKRTVPAYTQTEEQVRAYLRAELDRDAHWKEDQAFLEQFGFVPRSFDLRTFMIDFYTEQVAGYYDHRTGAFYMAPHAVSSDPSMLLLQVLGMGGTIQDSLVVHEMDHAMQDQHFGIARLEALMKGHAHDDQALAIQALVEGDAYVVMMKKMLGGLDSDIALSDLMDPDDVSAGGNGDVFDRAPLYIKKLALFPYLHGGVFVDFYLRRDGWSAVNRIYAHPPRSTEQILHPEKYGQDEPRILKLPQDPGVPRLAENTVGEERMRILWDRWAPTHGDRHEWSNGWGGDIFRIYGEPHQPYLLWVTTWDDEGSAYRFAAGLRHVLRGKDRVKLSETRGAGPTSHLRKATAWGAVKGERAWQLEVDGSTVIVVAGAPLKAVRHLIELAWRTAGLPRGAAPR